VHEGSYYIYAVWADNRTGNYDVYFARSIDGGATFTPPVKINDDTTALLQRHPIPRGKFRRRHLRRLHDERNGTKDVYFSRSLDNGLTFSANTKVNYSTSNTDQCVVAVGSR
jgi:hypothetical protein